MSEDKIIEEVVANECEFYGLLKNGYRFTYRLSFSLKKLLQEYNIELQGHTATLHPIHHMTRNLRKEACGL